MSGYLLNNLSRRFGQQIIEHHDQRGDLTVVLSALQLLDIARWLRDDPETSFELLRDVTAVDWADQKRPRFEVVYHLYSLTHRHALRVKVPVEQEQPEVPSLASVWPACQWGEREVWDMFGIHFVGHPFLRRILLYEEFEGHPLRKDYDKRLSQPRITLLDQERDAIDEYEHWCDDHGENPSQPPLGGGSVASRPPSAVTRPAR